MPQQKVPIDIKIVTTIFDKGAADSIAIQTTGLKYEKNHAIFFTYEETLEHGGNVQTIVKVTEDKAHVLRSGAISMRHMYHRGHVTESTYRSLGQAIAMKTKTDTLLYKYNDRAKSGMLQFGYRLTLAGSDVGRYRMILTFTEVE